MLMFGNQQNRQAANAAAATGESFVSNAEKRELLPALKDRMLANTVGGLSLEFISRKQEPSLPRAWEA